MSTTSGPRLLALALTVGFTMPAVGGSLRYAEDQAPGIINPVFTTTMSEARVNELIFDGLYTDNQELSSEPALVASSTVDEDRTGMTLVLRSDVYWHDGTPFTSEDVVFTIDAMKDEKSLSTEAGRVQWIQNAEAVDSSTVRLVFEKAELRPEDKLYFKILPKHKFESTVLKRSDPFRSRPLGTGPYTLDRYNDDNSITFTAFEDFREQTGIPEMVMREVSDKNYQAKLLLYESLEALVRVLPRDLAVLQNNRKVELYPYQTNSWWYVGFNLARTPFDDPNVRQAIASMVEIDALLAPIGTGEILSGPFVKSSPYYNHKVEPWSYDEMSASSLLEASGWLREGEFWTRDGEPLTLTLTAHQSVESSQEVVINLQSQLEAGGVRVEVEFLDEAAWKARIWRERSFDVILSQWSFDRNEDVWEQLHSTGSRNFGQYASQAVDELLSRSRTTTDPYEKKAALRKVHELVHQDAPMVFLWTLDSYAAMSTKVSNVVIHPFYFFTYVREWRMR